MNENETETKQCTLDKVIEECPYGTSSAMIEDFGNEELDDSNPNFFE